jgi:hypothetical protein
MSEPRTYLPSKTLFINAQGIPKIHIPTPLNELEIRITNANKDIAYVSKRHNLSTANATLFDASGKELLDAVYLDGPGREPTIRVLGQDVNEKATIVTKGKWTSRSRDFVLPDGRIFTWSYIREADVIASAKGKEKQRSHLVLEVSDAGSAVNDQETKTSKHFSRVAELVRNEETYTPGTSSTHTGNGGELKIDSSYCDSIGLNEDVVVMSCLMMLKKELDRGRIVQHMVFVGVSMVR